MATADIGTPEWQISGTPQWQAQTDLVHVSGKLQVALPQLRAQLANKLRNSGLDLRQPKELLK